MTKLPPSPGNPDVGSNQIFRRAVIEVALPQLAKFLRFYWNDEDVKTNMPDDLTILSARVDCCSGQIRLVCESSEFEEVTEGYPLPIFCPQYEIVRKENE